MFNYEYKHMFFFMAILILVIYTMNQYKRNDDNKLLCLFFKTVEASNIYSIEE